MQNTQATANPNPESENVADDDDEGNTGLKVRTNLKGGYSLYLNYDAIQVAPGSNITAEAAGVLGVSRIATKGYSV
ncbi:MAG: hypothetical protein JNJ46_14595 [Myxococcales bacterium]|nr:hypothetical protein [Myxococcales bacterium]